MYMHFYIKINEFVLIYYFHSIASSTLKFWSQRTTVLASDEITCAKSWIHVIFKAFRNVCGINVNLSVYRSRKCIKIWKSTYYNHRYYHLKSWVIFQFFVFNHTIGFGPNPKKNIFSKTTLQDLLNDTRMIEVWQSVWNL